MLDPIKYLFESGSLHGMFTYPGQIATNPGGPYRASGVISVHTDWIRENGQNWTLTINTPKPLVFFPAQFHESGQVLSAWVAFDSNIQDWSSYSVTAVRNGVASTLTGGTSGLEGSLNGVDLTDPAYEFLPMALQGGLHGIMTKAGNAWHKFVLIVGIIILIVAIFKIYHLVKG